MALKLKTINWRNSQLPTKVNGNMYLISTELPNSGWNIVQWEDKTFKLIIEKNGCKMSIYLSTMTVQTAMNHPKKGQTQLTRKNVTATEFKKLLNDPRLHTNKGYYKKPVV